MKLAILTPSISRLSGGMFYSVKQLARALIKKSIDIKVFSSSDSYTAIDLEGWDGIPVSVDCSNFGAFIFSKDTCEKLDSYGPSLVYLNGMWTWHSILTARLARRGVSTIIAPRGMLDGWALNNSRRRKLFALKTYEKWNFASAKFIQALNEKEALSIRKIFPFANVRIIPNGIEPSEVISKLPKQLNARDERLTLGFLGRLDPKKGIKELLVALTIMRSNKVSFLPHLKIAGWGDENYVKELKSFVSREIISEYVTFEGPLYGHEKESFFRRIDAMILPSHSEGLPMAILEAWARGLPVLYTDECNLQIGFDRNAALRISNQPTDLARSLTELLQFHAVELEEIGRRGRDLANEAFSWDRVADQMLQDLFK